MTNREYSVDVQTMVTEDHYVRVMDDVEVAEVLEDDENAEIEDHSVKVSDKVVKKIRADYDFERCMVNPLVHYVNSHNVVDRFQEDMTNGAILVANNGFGKLNVQFMSVGVDPAHWNFTRARIYVTAHGVLHHFWVPVEELIKPIDEVLEYARATDFKLTKG